jgi:hypothetical protein
MNAQISVCLFFLKVALPKILAKSFLEVLLCDELELVKQYWHAKKLLTIQTKTSFWAMTKNR